MACILKIVDPVLSSLLGKSEFSSQDELREAFGTLLSKSPVIPLIIRPTGKNTFNKYAKAFYDGDKIRIEIPIPGQEFFNSFKFVTRGKGDIEIEKYGTPNSKYLDLDSLDSFIAFYFGNYLYLDNETSVEKRLHELAIALKNVEHRIETKSGFSYGAADINFLNSLLDYYHLLQPESDFTEIEISGKKQQVNIPEVIDKIKEIIKKVEEKEKNKVQSINKTQYVPKEIIHEDPNGLFFEAYDVDREGNLQDNEVTLGRRILINSVPNSDEYRIRLERGSKKHAQHVSDLTEQQIINGVVGVIEKWEGEWKPVFLHKDTKISIDNRDVQAQLTTDPNQAYMFTYSTDSEVVNTPQLFLMLTGNNKISETGEKGRVNKLKSEFQETGKEKAFSIIRVDRKSLKGKSIDESLDNFGIVYFKDQPDSGRIFLIKDGKTSFNIERGTLNDVEIEEVLVLLEQSYKNPKEVATYLNEYIGLGQDIADLSESTDPNNKWHIDKLRSNRIVTFYSEGDRISVLGERKKVGDTFVVEPEQRKLILTPENKDLIKSYLQAARINVKAEEGNISLAWTKLIWDNGLKRIDQSGKLREKFYRDHLKIYDSSTQRHALVAVEQIEFLKPEDKKESQRLIIGDYTFIEDNDVQEGTINQLLSTLKPNFPIWDSYQWDLLQNLFQNTKSPTYKFVSNEFLKERTNKYSPAAFDIEGTIYLNINTLQNKDLWVSLLPWVLEERLHHLTIEKLNQGEWLASQEVKNLKSYREILLKEWEKVKDTYNEKDQKGIEYVIQPNEPIDSNEALKEFVVGIGKFNSFSRFANTVQHKETSLLQKIKDAILNLLNNILSKVSGLKKDILIDVLNIIYGEPTTLEIEEKEEKKLKIIGPGKKIKSEDFYSAQPEDYIDNSIIEGLDADVSQVLFDYNVFKDFVTGNLSLDSVKTYLRDAYNAEWESELDDERRFFIYTILKDEETFDKTIEDWKKRSAFFKLSNNFIEIEEDDNNEELSEEQSNEGEFNNWDRTVQSKSSQQEADKYARILVKFTPKGFHKGRRLLADYTSLWNKIQDLVKDSFDYNEMIEKGKLSDNPQVQTVIQRLESLQEDTLSQIIRSSFQRSFARHEVPTYVAEFSKINGEWKGYFKEQGTIDRSRIEEVFDVRFIDYIKRNSLQINVSKIVETEQGNDIQEFPSFKVEPIRDLLNKNRNNLFSLADIWKDMGLEIPDSLINGTESNKFLKTLYNLTIATLNKLNFLAEHNLYPDEISLRKVLKSVHSANKVTSENESTRWYNAIDRISKYSDLTTSNMSQNAEGENQSNLHTYSTYTLTLKKLNDAFQKAETSEEAIQIAINEGLLRLKNPIFKYSLTNRYLSALNPIIPVNLSGSRVYYEEDTIGTNSINLDFIGYLRQEFFTFLKSGVKENLRAETANTSLGYKFRWGTNPKDILPILPDQFRGNWQDKAVEIFSGYLTGEVERIQQELKSPYKYYKKYDKKKLNFSIFSFLPEDLKTKWKSQIETKSAPELVENWQQEFIPELVKFFQKQREKFENLILNKTGEKITPYHPIFDSQIRDMIRELGIDAVMNSFVVNSLISNIEHIIVSHGELGEFDKFYKRSKSNISVGVNSSFRSIYPTLKQIGDKSFTYSIYKELPEYYNEQEVPTAKSFILSDDILSPGNEWMNRLKESVIESITLSYKAFGIEKTQEEIKDEATKKIQDYKKSNVGDGGGFMHPDFGRAFLLSVGSWTKEREDGYRYLVFRNQPSQTPQEQKFIGRVHKLINKNNGIYWTFPIVKAQYRGNSKPISGEPVSAIEQLDKFALQWIFPSGNEVEKVLFDLMTKEGFAYGKFESGSKIGTYEPDNLNDFKGNSSHIVYTDFLKEQVKTPEHLKVETIFPTQQRKLLISNLKVKGEYIGDLGKVVKRWKHDQKQISNEKRTELLKALGEQEGKINLDKFAKMISKELEKRDLPESITSIFDLFNKTDYYKNFESSLSPQNVETLLYSLFKNKVVRNKFKGSQLIVKPASFGHHDLEFYRIVNGKVLPADCKVTLMGDFLSLLTLPEVIEKAKEINLNYEDNSYDKIEVRRQTLNLLLKDQSFRNSHSRELTVYSQRIPTQGYNSMEIMMVKEFLPIWDGPHIIPHPQIVTKAGSDNDYDKLPTLFPSIENGKAKSNSMNYLIEQAEKVLLDPINFHRLVTPNTTDLIVPQIEAITRQTGNLQEFPEDSEVYSLATAYKKWDAVKIKDLLGIGAVNNTFYSLLQNADAQFNPQFYIREVPFNSASSLLSSNEKSQVDLSSPYIINSTDEKVEYINQFINLTVDAASNDIAGYVNMIRDNTGLVVLQLEQGVPFDRILDLIEQPIVKKYHQLVSVNLSQGMSQSDSKKDAFSQLLKIDITKESKFETVNRKGSEIWEDIKRLVPDTIPQSYLKSHLNDENITTKDRQVLAFYLVGIEQANAMREIQSYLNFDTRLSRDILNSESRQRIIKRINNADLINTEAIQRMKNDSVISHLDIHKDFKELSQQLFKIKRDPYFVRKAVDLGENILSNNDRESFYRMVDNDYLLSIVQNYGSINKEWVLEQLNGKLMSRWEKIKEEVKGTSIYDKLIPSYSTKTKFINPKFAFGLDQEASDFDKVAQDLRDMIHKGGELKDFALDLIKVGIYSTGFNQSPVYLLKALPYEFVAPILQEAYDKYEPNQTYIDKFLEKFRYERGFKFGKYFIEEYKNDTGLQNIPMWWRRVNFRQDAYRFVDYTFPIVQKSSTKQTNELTNQVQNEITDNRPTGIDLSNSSRVLWGSFNNTQFDSTTEFREFRMEDFSAGFDNTLQSKISGKTFKEVWDSNEFTTLERRRILLGSIQERISKEDTFNGKLFKKINQRLESLELRVIEHDLGLPMFTWKGQVYINSELFEKYLTESEIENIDKYLDLAIAEELIHVVTYHLTNVSDIILLMNEVPNYNQFKNELQKKYKSLNIKDDSTVFKEYIRMIVQQKILGTTTEKIKYTKGGIIDQIIQKVWDFLYSVFTNSNKIKQLVKKHTDFINTNDTQPGSALNINQLPKGSIQLGKYTDTSTQIRGETFDQLPESGEYDNSISETLKSGYYARTAAERVANYMVNKIYLSGGWQTKITQDLSKRNTPLGIILLYDDSIHGSELSQYENDIIINIRAIQRKIEKGLPKDYDKFLEDSLDEELIHALTYHLTTPQEILDIANELSEEDKQKVTDYYLSETGLILEPQYVAYEYIRMIVQQKVFGRTTEDSKHKVLSLTKTMIKILNKIRDYIMNIFENHPEYISNRVINQIIDKVSPLYNESSNPFEC